MKNIWSVEHILFCKRLDFQAKTQSWKKANETIKWPVIQNLRPFLKTLEILLLGYEKAIFATFLEHIGNFMQWGHHIQTAVADCTAYDCFLGLSTRAIRSEKLAEEKIERRAEHFAVVVVEW